MSKGRDVGAGLNENEKEGYETTHGPRCVAPHVVASIE